MGFEVHEAYRYQDNGAYRKDLFRGNCEVAIVEHGTTIDGNKEISIVIQHTENGNRKIVLQSVESGLFRIVQDNAMAKKGENE